MLQSMTGFGDACIERNGISVFVEVRSINNRYLKLTLRAGESLGSMETLIEEEIRKHILRGTVQVTLRLVHERTPDRFRINLPVLEKYHQTLCKWSKEVPGLTQHTFSPESLLSLPGVVEELTTEENILELWPQVQETLIEALKRLSIMRLREGEALAKDIMQNRQVIYQSLQNIVARAPQVSVLFAQRLVGKVNDLLKQFAVSVEQSDLLREVAIFADRCDISEEIARINSHLQQFETILTKEKSPGKKLDFLTQELFREVNTIGSKANDVEISHEVITMKACIERIREQVQNVE
ncbi:MAG: YicC/YloC family endoribonuclease [Planctomycetia bacterium]|nr:YicC/YloC family endoribonuclease [Planctomycetia bacterium]